MAITYSPLRYPGGKSQCYNKILDIFASNNINNPIYIEPFSGGAGIAIKLLLAEKVEKIILNDNDIAVFSFWNSVIKHKDWLVNKIRYTPVDIEQWRIQKKVYTESKKPSKELGFALFFLNRTNRSGIILAGPIGGKQQSGNYKLDCRFNKENLINLIEKIYFKRKKIIIHKYNAAKLIKRYCDLVNSFWFIDPPYYIKGSQLYKNYFTHSKHYYLSQVIDFSLKNQKWILTYDICPQILNMYKKYPYAEITLKYTIENRRDESEYLFYNKISL